MGFQVSVDLIQVQMSFTTYYVLYGGVYRNVTELLKILD